MADYERVTMTIEPELLAAWDALVASRGHNNRSEALRDLVRAAVLEQSNDDTPVHASLTLVYDHNQRAISDRLVDLAHDHHHLVLSTMHVHLDHDLCMEVSALRGPRAALEHYAAHVVGLKGVRQGRLVVAAGCA